MGSNKISFPQGCWIRKLGYDLTLQELCNEPKGKGNRKEGESENMELKVNVRELKRKNGLTRSIEI